MFLGKKSDRSKVTSSLFIYIYFKCVCTYEMKELAPQCLRLETDKITPACASASTRALRYHSGFQETPDM